MTRDALAGLLEDEAGLDARSLTEFYRHQDGAAIFTLTVPLVNARGVWQAARGAVEGTGYWPVILGEPDELEWHRLNLTVYRYADPETIIANAEAFDIGAWVKSQSARMAAEGEWVPAEEGQATDGYDNPRTFDPPYLKALSDPYNEAPFRPIMVGLVPTPYGWEAPAYLHFDEHNCRPQAHVHVALFREWHEVCGAELIVLTGETVEMVVPEPIAASNIADRVAREQEAYCRGAGSSAQLKWLRSWFFWWD